jgi:hypothetical protein
MTYKGSWQRPVQVSTEERDLRYELAFCKDEKRKRAIIRKLKVIEKDKNSED